MNLLLLEHKELDASFQVVVHGARHEHMRNVMNVSIGDHVRAGIIDGAMDTARVIDMNEARTMLDASALKTATAPARPRVDVLLAMPRPKVMKRMFTQLACLGVGHIFLTAAARVDRSYFDAHVTDESEYRPLLLEGLAQARDTRVPVVSLHPSLKWLVEKQMDRAEQHARRLIADVPLFSGDTRSIASACADVKDEERVLLAIGPEGGWQDDERNLLAAHGYLTVDLGERALRSDLACVSAMALIHEAIRRR